jgi:spore germination cell wall hydrolase CwlJ-like protein
MRSSINFFAIFVAMISSVAILTLAFDVRSDRLDRTTISDVGLGIKELDRQLACMTENIYWEAAGEPAEGKIAVAQIVMNRVQSRDFPNDPCAVIYQKDIFYSRVVCQFSWFCMPGFTDRKINQAMWRESQLAAKKVMLEGFRLPSLDGALYYHADYVNPRWRLDRVTQIGRHIFYQPRGQQI